MKMPTSYVECRTFGHAWERHTPHNAPSVSAPNQITLRCSRCSTVRVDGIDRNGELLGRRYVWPDDYLLRKDEERPSRASLRIILIREDRKKRRKAA